MSAVCLRRLKKRSIFLFFEIRISISVLGEATEKKGRGHFAGKSCVCGTFLKKTLFAASAEVCAEVPSRVWGINNLLSQTTSDWIRDRGNKNITWLGWKIQTLTIALFRGHFPEFPTFWGKKHLPYSPAIP